MDGIKDRPDLRIVLHDDGFGDLDHQPSGKNAVAVQNTGDARRQSRFELQRREIHGHIGLFHARQARQSGEIGDRLIENDIADALDGAVFFREADNGGRRKQALVRVVEAQQRLETSRLAG
ncbi:hypothetical protein D3C78_1194220 [compost metagenome]